MNHSDRADVYFNKVDPHMEYISRNYWLSNPEHNLCTIWRNHNARMQKVNHKGENNITFSSVK